MGLWLRLMAAMTCTYMVLPRRLIFCESRNILFTINTCSVNDVNLGKTESSIFWIPSLVDRTELLELRNSYSTILPTPSNFYTLSSYIGSMLDRYFSHFSFLLISWLSWIRYCPFFWQSKGNIFACTPCS